MSAAAKRGNARPVARRKPPKVSAVDRLLATLPIGEETIRKLATGAIMTAAGAAVLAAAVWAGIPGAIGTAVAEQVGRAGLRVEQIEVTGRKRMDRMSVYAVASAYGLRPRGNSSSGSTGDIWRPNGT